jgi:hypothetical protein
MSLEVELGDVRRHVERLGALANLISTGDDGAPHVVSVLVAAANDRLHTTVGGRTRANLVARHRLCLLWPVPAPAPAGGGRYQLILDGEAATIGDLDDAGRAPVTIDVMTGILHRVAGTHVDSGDAPSCISLDTPGSPPADS